MFPEIFTFQNFLEGNCHFKGTLSKNTIKVVNDSFLRKCPEYCQSLKNCQYYLYDVNTKICSFIIGSDVRRCDVIMGPPEPTINGCPISTT